MTLPGRQRGVALIVVLMIFAMVFTLAVEIVRQQEGYMTRTENLLNWDRRYQYAMAAEKVAVQGLIDDLEADQEEGSRVDDCQDERWAVRLPPSPYEDALLSATVQDLQGRFNLNWVVKARENRFVRDEQGRRALERLLQSVLARPEQARTLSFEMTDWIDSNNLVDGVEGAEDAEYRHRRTPNLPVAHESELRALRTFDLEALPGDDVSFWSYFTALPVDTTLNLNTASTAVLDAVLGAYGANAASAVEELRNEGPITEVGALFGVAPFNELDSEERQALQQWVGVQSSYFQVMIDVELQEQRSRLVTRIFRNPEASESEQRRASVISRQVVPVLGPLEPACNPHYNAPQQGTDRDNTLEPNRDTEN
jgi:general secretion pathway protein K